MRLISPVSKKLLKTPFNAIMSLTMKTTTVRYVVHKFSNLYKHNKT